MVYFSFDLFECNAGFILTGLKWIISTWRNILWSILLEISFWKFKNNILKVLKEFVKWDSDDKLRTLISGNIAALSSFCGPDLITFSL